MNRPKVVSEGNRWPEGLKIRVTRKMRATVGELQRGSAYAVTFASDLK